MGSSNVAKTSLRDQERPPSRLGIASDCGCRAGERRDAARMLGIGQGSAVQGGRGSFSFSTRTQRCILLHGGGGSRATTQAFRGRRRCGGETLGGPVQLGVY